MNDPTTRVNAVIKSAASLCTVYYQPYYVRPVEVEFSVSTNAKYTARWMRQSGSIGLFDGNVCTNSNIASAPFAVRLAFVEAVGGFLECLYRVATQERNEINASSQEAEDEVKLWHGRLSRDFGI